MRWFILAAVAALIATPVYAAEINGDTGQVVQPGTITPPASGNSGTAGNAGDLPNPGALTHQQVAPAGGQAGMRSEGGTPSTNKVQ